MGEGSFEPVGTATFTKGDCTVEEVVRQPRVVCMLPSMTLGIFHFRIKQPLDNWSNRYHGLVRYRLFGHHRSEDLTWGDVFVFQRMACTRVLEFIKILKTHGKRIVFEIDDLLIDLPSFMSHHRGTNRDQQALLQSIKLADVVTTTTKRLAIQLKALNSHVILVPNCVSGVHDFCSAHVDNSVSPVTLIVAASDIVVADVLRQPLKALKLKYGAGVRLVAVGPIAQVLMQGGVAVEGFPVVPYADFRELLRKLSNPVGLIPLDESLFSSCKSPIKFFDYAVAQVPSICSNVPPYSDYVQNGETGLLVENTSTAWFTAIESLVTSSSERRRISDAAREYVIRTHLEDEAGDAWQAVIKELKVQRVLAPGLVIAAKKPFSLSRSAIRIASQLLQGRTYKTLYEIFMRDGIRGLKDRITRRQKDGF